MAIIQPLKKLFNWQTAHEKIQDAPKYTIDWATIPDPNPTLNVNSWRGIIDMENFPGGLLPPGPSFLSSVNFTLSGPMVATTREDFYIQLTPYYHPENGNRGLDGTVPYLLPAGFVAPGVTEIEIYNASPAGTWGGNLYIYFELGVNYKGS